MNKEELKLKLKPNKFNDTTMDFLTTAINDVLELYGEYISEDIIIGRIKQNLESDIKFVEKFTGNKVGEYDYDKKAITLLKREEAVEKRIFLHAFLHCISVHENKDGKTLLGFGKGRFGHGVNAAMTEYLTAQQYPTEFGAYQEEKESLRKILEIIPISEMIKSYLYGEPEIEELIKRHGMDDFNLLYSFDALKRSNNDSTNRLRFYTCDSNKVDAKQQIILEYIKGYCNSRKLEDINIGELMGNVIEMEGIINTGEEKSDFDYMQYINRIIAQKLQQGNDEEQLRRLPSQYIERINQQRAKEKIYNKTRKRILDENFSGEEDTYEEFFEDGMYMTKIIKKICGEGTIFEDESMKFNWAIKLWNELKARYKDINFDWIDFGFLGDKYIIARIGRRVIGAMNIDIDDENEYQSYKEVEENNSKGYRILNGNNVYIELNSNQNQGTYYQEGSPLYESEDYYESVDRIIKIRQKEKELKRWKSLNAPDIMVKRLETEIEQLSRPKKKLQQYSIEYVIGYLERQKANGEIEENEYNAEIRKRSEWIAENFKESCKDDVGR